LVQKLNLFFFKNAFSTTSADGKSITIHNICGSYVTDPIKLINILIKYSRWMIISGDCGGGTTKIGITYKNKKQKTVFTPILIYDTKESYQSLSFFNTKGIISFTGDSSSYHTIYEVFQHFIGIKKVYLGGDWSFINSILGIGSASSTHPCFICLINKNSFGSRRRPLHRITANINSHSQQHPPLLTISPQYIIPIPLHLFLGISNKIISEVLVDELGVNETKLKMLIKSIRTTHSHSSIGRSSVHALNGNELVRWVKKVDDFITPSPFNESHFIILIYWIQQLSNSLLHGEEWTRDEINEFKCLVKQIQSSWSGCTNRPLFPKIHMLHHAAEFVSKHHALGLFSEAPIESFHAKFNEKYRDHHYNKGSSKAERIRRSHADLLLESISS
jgi:hypothetical protein